MDREDIETLVKGSQPQNYEQIGSELFNKAGYYSAGLNDRWYWDSEKIKGCSTEDLWNIYRQCKKNYEHSKQS